ncbi:hypothetical protein ABEB36_002210 [Hypothenemus hampei]|uniref:U6 small nuclear RNA (adenine-(43)-N(6))-methyltransferase n=1 Tax=Hypothenemus hampei TaxID=57062 RepID=A0ABD1F4X8_HYPHA
MSMNKFMHPRNIYKTPPDFKQLAFKYQEFKNYVKLDLSGKPVFDFKNPEALRVLARTLLKEDFSLDVEIPKNKLVPTIPLRLNYILWIEDLLNYFQCNEGIKGIDIGTGASCIYPLLAVKKNNWRMLATETDDESIKFAQINIENNGLNTLISIVKPSGDHLLPDIDEDYDFCMCNPPFFASTQELHPSFKSRKLDRPRPKNAFVATVTEVVAKGGEVEFIEKLIEESLVLKTKIKLYTTMVGQKSDLPALKKKLREAKVFSFKETEFCQGNTTRWGLAWTYLEYDLRKVCDEAKLANKSPKKYSALLFNLPDQENNPENVSKVTDTILNMFKELKMTFENVTRNKKHPRYFVTAYSNTWANQRRKRREKLRVDDEPATEGFPNNNNDLQQKHEMGKRGLDDLLCESTKKKLRLSTESESSDCSTVFYKFMFAINCLEDKIVLELNNVDAESNRDYLHQILQYIKNNFVKSINALNS